MIATQLGSELDVNSREVLHDLREPGRCTPIVAAMPVYALIVTVVALVSVVGVVVLRRRLDARDRMLRSIGKAVGSTASDTDLVRDVRSATTEARALEARANGYAAALQGSSTGIAILSPTGGIEYMNPAAQLLLEGPRERAVLRTRVTALGQRVAGSGRSEVLEVDIHDPDRRVLSLTAVPLVAEGASVGRVCLYLDDLSARRRIETMRTDFVANASHELKTPLGALALLAETLAAATDEESRIRLAQRLQSEASRMANVIDDVLQLAETESLGAEYVHVAMAGVIEDAVKSVDTIAAEHGITIVGGDVVDAVVAGNREQLVSAVTNLLNNAITYTAVKGEPGLVRYRSYRSDAMVCVEVEDTGIGIPDRYQDRVFERFFRVDRARSRESGGTGLGLSIVRNVARAHGGNASVRSKVGVGSVFTISLPIVEDDPS